MQFLILISLILWSYIDPSENLALVISVGLLIAVSSATQDITVDALRIEQIGKMKCSMAAGAAMAVKDGGADTSWVAYYHYFLQNF